MTCHNRRTECERAGKHRNGVQRFHSTQCKKSFTEPYERPLDEMRLPLDTAETILKMLVEGERSVRSVLITIRATVTIIASWQSNETPNSR